MPCGNALLQAEYRVEMPYSRREFLSRDAGQASLNKNLYFQNKTKKNPNSRV